MTNTVDAVLELSNMRAQNERACIYAMKMKNHFARVAAKHMEQAIVSSALERARIQGCRTRMEGNAARINAVASYEAVMKPVDEKKAWMLACLNNRSMTVQEFRLMAGECRKQELTHLKELTRVCQELCREFPSDFEHMKCLFEPPFRSI